jgi:hypothetical protein
MKKILFILLMCSVSLQAQNLKGDSLRIKAIFMPPGAVEGYYVRVHANGRFYYSSALEALMPISVRGELLSLTSGMQYVSFSSVMAVSDYALLVRCYKSTTPFGLVGFTVSGRSAAGFVIQPLEPCTMEYLAVSTTLISSIVQLRAGTGFASTSGTTVNYDSTFGGTNYSLFLRVYKPNDESNGVGYSYTKSDTAFKLSPLDSCEFEYVAIGYSGSTSTVNLRAGLDSAGTTSRTINFSSTLATMNYSLFVNAFKSTSPFDNVPFSYVKSATGFVVTMLDTGYVSYLAMSWIAP